MLKKRLLLFALFLWGCTICCPDVLAQTEGKRVLITEALAQVRKVHGTQFVYDPDLLKNKTTTYSLENIKSKNPEDALKGILYPNNLVFLYVKKNYYTIVPRERLGETSSPKPPAAEKEYDQSMEWRTVYGIVLSENGEPVQGATVSAQKAGKSTASDAKGEFMISVNSKTDVLTVSSVGFKTQEIQVSNQQLVKINLETETTQMDDVVVIGYGKVRKVDVTGTVSSISGKDLADIPVSSSAEALAGRLAGVRVVTQDGEPGADVDITIRGGMSITQSNSPLYIIDGFASEVGLKGVDISEIESIDVLKDASTTSIYGARGANGVVLITTKKGKKGRTQVRYEAYFGQRKLPKFTEVLNSVDFVKLQYEMAQRAGGTSITSFTESYGEWDAIEANYAPRGLDWQRIMFGGTAKHDNHRFSISGGSDKSKFMFNYSLINEKGVLLNTDNKRHNFRFNFEQNLFSGVNLFSNISYFNNTKNGNITSGRTLQNTLLYRPVAGIAYTDEELEEAMQDPSNNSLQNPRAAQLSQLRRVYDNNLAINLAIDATFLKNFTFRASGSATYRRGRSDSFDDETSSAAVTRGGPFGSQSHSLSAVMQNTNTLSYNNKFGLHRITLMAGSEYIKSTSQSLGVENRQFPEDNFGIFDLSLGTLPQKPTASYEQNALMSFFGRAFYSFEERFLATFTLRADGSSKFSQENRWGYFPSASFAWRMKNERFLKPVEFISDLKLRLSYGQAGNNSIGNNRFRSTFETGWYTNGASEIPTLEPSVLANPGLRWEATVASNIGLDFGLYKNRISGTVEFYKNKTRDLLLTSAIPSYTGYTVQTRNIGSLQNHGVELTLNTTNIKTRNFTWSTNFNISFNKNKVLELTTTDEDYMLFKSGVGSYMDDFIVRIGQATGSIYGYVYGGLYGVDEFTTVFNEATGRYVYTLKPEVLAHADWTRANVQPGSQRYVDVNNDGVINTDDRTIIGNTQPKHFGGFSNNIMYKNFDLGIFLNWSYGNNILNYQKARLISTYSVNQNQSALLRNRFTYIDADGNYVSEPTALKALNQNATIHGVKTNGPESNITYTSSDFVEDGSYLRINNITLGYTFSPSLIRKAWINSLRIYASVYNLHTFTKYSGFDPEVNKSSNGGLTPGVDWAAYPRTRNVVVGLNLSL
ncbi:MAG: SusC/RagA family TonB-linked outer membrane protein [Niabella sp.]